MQIQTGLEIHLGIVNQSTVQWQVIPSESQINSKDLYDLPNRLEQLDVHGKCTFINKMVTGIQLQQNVMENATKFHLNIFSKELTMECISNFAITRIFKEVENGRDTFQLPMETKSGGIYDGNKIEFIESAPISGVGFYTYLSDNVIRHRPYIFSLNYGMLLQGEGFVGKLGQSLQLEPGFYTKHNYL